MKIRLFRAPYVDDMGASRERICAVVISPAPIEGDTLLKPLREWLAKIPTEPSLLAIAYDGDDEIDLGWL